MDKPAVVESKPLDDDADAVHSKSRAYATNLHTRPRQSLIQILSIERDYPDLWAAIQELEPAFVIAHEDGLWLQNRLYLGIIRSGSKYLDTWIKENHVDNISHRGMTILRALAFYKKFTTYDKLLEYLKTHNWGELMPDRGLDSYPKKTLDEENTERMISMDDKFRAVLEKEQKDSYQSLLKRRQNLEDLMHTIKIAMQRRLKENKPAEYEMFEKRLQDAEAELAQVDDKITEEKRYGI